MSAGIKKILGYRKEGEVEYFHVCWSDQTKTWEAFDNLNCHGLVQSFFKRCLRRIDHTIEHLEGINKKKREQDFISAVKSINEKRKGINNNQPIANEIAPAKAVESGKAFIREIDTRKAGVTPEGSKVLFKDSWMNGGSDMTVTPKKIPRSGVPVFQEILYSAPANYSHVPRIIKKNITIKSNNLEVASFASRNISGQHIVYFSFVVEKCGFLDSNHLLHYLISIVRSPKQTLQGSISALSSTSTSNTFFHLSEKLSKESLALVSSGDEKFFYFFYSNNKKEDLSKYDLLFKYYILKVPKSSMIHISFALKHYKALFGGLDPWKESEINYQSLAGDKILFLGSDFVAPKGLCFGFIGDIDNPMSKILLDVLASRSKKLTRIQDDRVSFVIITQQMLHLIHHNGDLSNLLPTPCRFYLFRQNVHEDECSAFKLIEILKRNIMLTFTQKFIEIFNVVQFENFMDTVSGRVVVRITASILGEFKKRFADSEKSPEFHSVRKVYKLLKRSIEDYACQSTNEYLEYLESKHYEDHRLFLMLNDVTLRKNVLSFDDFVEKTRTVILNSEIS